MQRILVGDDRRIYAIVHLYFRTVVGEVATSCIIRILRKKSNIYKKQALYLHSCNRRANEQVLEKSLC